MKVVRILKKTGKIILYTILSIILFVIVVLVVAKICENKITHIAMEEVSEIIHAPVKCDSVSLLLLRRFPYATVEFKGFKLGATTDTVNFGKQQLVFDTLFSFDRVYVSIKTLPILESKFEVKQIEVAGINLNYAVDSAGVTNFDFLLTSDTTQVVEEEPVVNDTTTSILNVLLKDLTLRDIALNYKDDQMKAQAHVEIPEIHIEGKVIDDYYAGLLKGSVLVNNCLYEGFNVELMKETSLNFDLNYDNGKADIKQLQLLSDGIGLLLAGSANVGDSIFVDMDMKLVDMDFNELSKYAPAEMLAEFGLKEIQGLVNITADVNGYYYDTLLLPTVNANLNLKNCRVVTTDYPTLENVAFNVDVAAPNAYDMSTLSAQVHSFEIKTPASKIELSASVKNVDKPVYDFKTNLFIHLDEFASLIPEGTVESLSGDIRAKLATKGQLPSNLGMSSADYFLDRTSIDFSLINIATALDSATSVNNLFIDFAYRPNRHFAIKNLSLDAPGYGVSLGKSLLEGDILGRVSDMDNMGAKIDSFYFAAGNSNIGGNLYLKGLVKPDFDINTDINVVIDDMIKQFIPDSLVDDISGEVSLALKSHGQVHLDSIDSQIMPIAFEQSEVKLGVRNFNFDMFGDTLVKIKNFGLDFAMANDTLSLDNFYGSAHGVELWIDSTKIWNVYRAVMLEQADQQVMGQVHVKLGDLDYATFAHIIEDSTATDSTAANLAVADSTATNTLAIDSTSNIAQVAQDSTTTASDTAESFMPNFLIRGSFAVNSARYDKNYIEDIGLKFRVENTDFIVVEDFHLKTFGGLINTSVVYDSRSDTVDIIDFKNDITGLDINKLLKDNDDFGMSEDISYKNISGILTSSISGHVLMDTAVVYDKLNVIGDFELADGGIYDFEPIMEIGKFTGMKELENINFKTLKTSLFIFKNKIYIPKTDIVSTALDLSAYGMQSFAEDYEYHAVVHLGDVLLGKSDNLMKKQGLEGDITSADDKNVDRKGLYLVVMENQGVNKTGFDNKKLQRKMQNTIKVQNAILGVMFHPKMVNFSTDFDRSKNVKKVETESSDSTNVNKADTVVDTLNVETEELPNVDNGQ